MTPSAEDFKFEGGDLVSIRGAGVHILSRYWDVDLERKVYYVEYNGTTQRKHVRESRLSEGGE